MDKGIEQKKATPEKKDEVLGRITRPPTTWTTSRAAT